MKVFIIHRFKDKKIAKTELKQIECKWSLKLHPIFLDSFGTERWKQKALNAINQAEAVIVFNRESCDKSDNASWEIKKAQGAGKAIISINQNNKNLTAIKKLKSLYDFKDEFDKCFSSNNTDFFNLYKIMIESSENLIQRRQKTNAFFITVIGSLLLIASFLLKMITISNGSFKIILYGFPIVIILLCKSWYNLIDNYGKLNKAKFDVILQLEKKFGAQIYSAEWVALGKGIRPKKYKSFTSTEKNVPKYFGTLIVLLTLVFTLFWICSPATTH